MDSAQEFESELEVNSAAQKKRASVVQEGAINLPPEIIKLPFSSS